MPKFLVNIDLNQNEIQNVSLQKLTTAPSNPTKGQVYYNTVDNRSYYWNGNSWVGMDSFEATMSAENIVTAINGSTFLIDDDNLSANVNDAISKAHNTHAISDVSGLQTVLDSKVDEIAGKGLSTNDYTTTEKTKLSGITTGATKVEDSIVNGNIKINGVENVVYSHPTGTNPHGTTKADVGLGEVDNTSDLDKPISTATQTALNGKVDNSRVLTDVPASAKFTDTVTTINGKTGVIVKADIVALGIPAQDTVYTLPVANGTTLGGVKSGTDITVDVSGNVSVNDDSHNHIISNVDGLQTALDGKSGTSHNHTLDDLSNVTVTSNSNGEILKYNGTAWVNNTLAEAGIATSDHDHSGTYAPNTHSHAILDVTGLQTELDSKETPAGSQAKANVAESNAKDYVDSKVLTDVPVNAKFTDTVYSHPSSHPASMITESSTRRFVSDSEKLTWNSKSDTDTVTTINGKTGAISKADIVALGIPAQDTDTTYTEITTAEIDAGTDSTLRTITARRLKYLLDKIVALFPTKTSELTNDSGFLTSVTKSDVGLSNVDNVKQATKTEFDALSTKVTSHEADDVSQGELHGFRLNQDKKLEYFNGIEYVEVKGGGYPVSIVKNVSASAGDGEIELMWEDPDNMVVDGVTIAEWNHTKVMRKVGSYPLHEDDGELVISNGVRNAYKDTPYSDIGLQNGTTYYYAMFPTTTEEIVTISEVSRVSATPAEVKIYGVEIDESNSNPKTSVVYTDDAVGFTPMNGNDGNFQWGSWKSIFNDLGIKPVMLKNGVEQYDLDPNDFSKKLGGGNADITSGNDGDVMIKFPKIYWKINKLGDKLQVKFSTKEFEGAICKAHTVGSSEKDHIYISAYLGTEVSGEIRSLSGKTPINNQTIGTMRNKAQTNGTGYQQMTYYNLLMLQVLYIVFFKNRDSQSALGRGRVDGAGFINTGGTNNKGMFYGSTSDEQIKFCGIEDFWGNRYYWIDGLYSDSNRNIMISKQDVFNNNGSGYENYGQGATANINGFIGTVQGGNETGFIIKTSDGSATTKYTDNGSLTGGRLGFFGGYQDDGEDTGAFRLRVDFDALKPSPAISARVCFIGS